MPAWPATFPDPVFDTIELQAPVGAVIRTDMDAGPAKQRPRFTAAAQPIALVFQPLTEVQVAEFEAFYRADLSMGALSFEMRHPILEVLRRFRFTQAGSVYSITPVGKNAYQLSTSMELLP